MASLALLLFATMSLLVWNTNTPVALLGDATPTRAHDAGSPTLDLSAAEAGTPAADQPVTEPPATHQPATDQPATDPPSVRVDPAAALGLWLSALSAITALIGLASSLWLGWRKERREMAQHQLELEKAQLEIRKLRQELAATSREPHTYGSAQASVEG